MIKTFVIINKENERKKENRRIKYNSIDCFVTIGVVCEYGQLPSMKGPIFHCMRNHTHDHSLTLDKGCHEFVTEVTDL